MKLTRTLLVAAAAAAFALPAAAQQLAQAAPAAAAERRPATPADIPVGTQVVGPDGQPAISYYDDSNLDLKFARMGIFTPGP